MIAKARTVTRRWHSSYDQDWNDPLTCPDHTLADSRAVKYHDHLKVCSKLYHGCGNPRRGGWYSPLTIPEQQAEAELQEELDELRGWVDV